MSAATASLPFTGWRVVWAAFTVAVFGWGVGFNSFGLNASVEDGDVVADADYAFQGFLVYVRTFFERARRLTRTSRRRSLAGSPPPARLRARA